MCGIVGLLIRKQQNRDALGEYAVPMLSCMGARGADSAGLAVFSDPLERATRHFSLFSADRAYNWDALCSSLQKQTKTDCHMESSGSHGTLSSSIHPKQFADWIKEYDPKVHVLSVGRHIEMFKDIGHPSEIAERYGFKKLSGTHCVGHTRMATESAVTPAHSHPFTAGEDFCLVHNGSLSNPYSLRRRLEKEGIHFETDNDTEAACRFLEWRMRSGDSLKQALTTAFEQLDGFYTLLMGTPTELVLVRDAFACKPAVVAEHDDYVAVSSEYRALAHLPDVANARVFEPQPQEIYSWKV